MTNKLLYLFFIFFSLFDLYLTNHFLTNTIIKELNPLALFVFKHSGLIGLLALKNVSIIIFILCCLKIGKHKKLIEQKLLVVALSMLGAVNLYSYYAIKTEKIVVYESVWDKTDPLYVNIFNVMFHVTDNFVFFFFLIYFMINYILYFLNSSKKDILNGQKAE